MTQDQERATRNLTLTAQEIRVVATHTHTDDRDTHRRLLRQSSRSRSAPQLAARPLTARPLNPLGGSLSPLAGALETPNQHQWAVRRVGGSTRASVGRQVLRDHLGMLVAKLDAVREGDARAVVAAHPQAVRLRLGGLQLLDEIEVAQLVLRDSGGPQLNAEHLGRRRVFLEQHLPAALVNLRDDLILTQVGDAHVARAANVVEQQVVVGRRAAGEEGGRP
mmetsp:Transcript_2539/g.6408  ORF Transcript_2539/g.6408 Transcript_2539/m.6408 type:complete len:221 (-) Transcript_2539:65-727(-)